MSISETKAETTFKNAVRKLINEGTYPGPAAIQREIGHKESGVLNGRQLVWRTAVLREAGWTHSPGENPAWAPPPARGDELA